MANNAVSVVAYAYVRTLPSEARSTVKFGNYDRIRNFVVLLSLLNLYHIKYNMKYLGHVSLVESCPIFWREQLTC